MRGVLGVYHPNTTTKSDLGGKGFASVHSFRGGELRTGPWGRLELKPRPWRRAVCWLALWLVQPAAAYHPEPPAKALPTATRVPAHQWITQTTLHRLTYKASLREAVPPP